MQEKESQNSVGESEYDFFMIILVYNNHTLAYQRARPLCHGPPSDPKNEKI